MTMSKNQMLALRMPTAFLMTTLDLLSSSERLGLLDGAHICSVPAVICAWMISKMPD